ncbi:MAG: TolC family protein [Rikenellaceae bacterium]|nr:TolC family protein [Rikenellaceae bacterium]
MRTPQYYILAIILILLSLSSCSNRRIYTAPDIDAGYLFREGPDTDTVTIADIPWQEFFTDRYLLEFIEEGLKNNSDMLTAYAAIQIAEANLDMARAAFFPTISLVGEVQETLLSNGTKGKKILGYSTPQYTLGISSTWEADIWGKLAAQRRSQYAQFLYSLEYRNLIQTSLISNIATSYYTLLALDEQLRITRETAELLWSTVETMAELMDAGIQNGAAVQQSLAAYYAAVVTIPDLETQIYQSENALSVLLRRNPGPVERSTLQEQDSAFVLHYGIPAQALSRRPDVKQAELSLRSAFELTTASRAAFYPTIALGIGSLVGYESTSLSHFFRPENILASILGQITQPIFAQRELKGNLKIAKTQQQEALITFCQTVLEAGQEVSDLLFSYRSSLSKNPIRANQIKSLETAVYFTQELLIAGEANYTEVLTAQQSLLSAQLDRTSDRLEQLQYRVELYKALGGGSGSATTNGPANRTILGIK